MPITYKGHQTLSATEYTADQFTLDHWAEYATNEMLTTDEITLGIDILMQGGDEAKDFADAGWSVLARTVKNPDIDGWARYQLANS